MYLKIYFNHLPRLAIKGLPDQLKPLAIVSFLVASLSILAYFFNLFAPIVYGHDEDDAKLFSHPGSFAALPIWRILHVKYMSPPMIIIDT